MQKALSGAALLTLLALPAQADQKNVTYEFKLLSETQRLADGTVEVVAIPHPGPDPRGGEGA